MALAEQHDRVLVEYGILLGNASPQQASGASLAPVAMQVADLSKIGVPALASWFTFLVLVQYGKSRICELNFCKYLFQFNI